MAISEYLVTGMSCGHCERSIHDEVGEVAGVNAVEVSAGTGRLTVTGSEPVDDAAVMAAVEEAGYQAVRV